MEQENKEFRFNRLQRAKLRVGPRIQRKSMKDERAKQPPLWAEKSEQTFSLPLGFSSSLQIWGVGWAEDSSPPPIDLAQTSPGSARLGQARRAAAPGTRKVTARFGRKCSDSLKTGLQRRMKQQPAKNHSANTLPRRISLVKSSVQKFTP